MHNTTKKLTLFAIVALLTVTTANAGLTDNLEMYSSMDTITGTNVPDDSGNIALGGTLQGSAAQYNDTSSTNARGLVLNLGGVNADYVTYGDVVNPGTGSFTISAWFYVNQTSTTQNIVTNGNEGSASNGWSIFIQNGVLHTRACYEGGGIVNNVNTNLQLGVNQAVNANEWYHVALVVDNTNGILQGYLNGLGSGTTAGLNGTSLDNDWTAGGGGGDMNYFTAPQDFTSSVPTYIGRRYDDYSPYPLDGMIDDVAIWSRALSSEEIGDIAGGAPVPEPGTIALLASMLAAGLLVRRKR